MIKFLPCLVISLLVLAAISSEASDHDEWHMEYAFKQRVSVTLFMNGTTRQGGIKEYDVFAAVPPELAQQRQIRSSFHVRDSLFRVLYTNELSIYHRPIMIARIAAVTAADEADLTVSATHEVTLFTRRLVQGANPNVSPTLPPSDRAVATADSRLIDYKSPKFSAFLDANHLRRQPSESAIAFGHRAQQFVHEKMTPVASDNKSLSDLCDSPKGLCGEHAWFFVGIMRASGIPARALVGHWVNLKSEIHQPHVKTEFFADGVGWIPVDPGSSFGTEEGNFLTLHLYLEEPLALPTPHWNVVMAPHLQGVYMPVVGRPPDKTKRTEWLISKPIDSPDTSASQTTTSTPTPDVGARLKELKGLFDQQLINKEVYEHKKKEIIDSL